MVKSGALAISALLMLIPGVRADVANSAPNGFTIKISQAIQAPSEEVYRRLVRNVGDWWNPQHTYSNNAHNLSIEEKPMGCFCEKLPNQGGIRHMEVIHVNPAKILVMTGALGPLQSLAATGTMTIQFSPAAGGTKLDVSYAVAGYLPGGMNSWAVPVDAMLTEQFARLKTYIEQGNPAPK